MASPRKRLTASLRAGPIVQNKANSAEARSTLTALQEKDYGKIGGLRVCENKANLQGRDCFPRLCGGRLCLVPHNGRNRGRGHSG